MFSADRVTTSTYVYSAWCSRIVYNIIICAYIIIPSPSSSFFLRVHLMWTTPFLMCILFLCVCVCNVCYVIYANDMRPTKPPANITRPVSIKGLHVFISFRTYPRGIRTYIIILSASYIYYMLCVRVCT